MSHPSGRPGPQYSPHHYRPEPYPGQPSMPYGGRPVSGFGAEAPQGPGVARSSRTIEVAAACLVIFLGALAVVAGISMFLAAQEIAAKIPPAMSTDHDRWLGEIKRDSVGLMQTFGTSMFLLALMGFVGGYVLLRGKATVGVTLVSMVGFAAFGGGMVGLVLTTADGRMLTPGGMFGLIGSLVVVFLGVITLGLALSGSTRRWLLPVPRRQQQPPRW